MSGPNLLDSSRQPGASVIIPQLDQTVQEDKVLDLEVINSPADETDADFEGGFRGWSAILGAQVFYCFSYLKCDHFDSTNVYSFLVQFCTFGYGVTFK